MQSEHVREEEPSPHKYKYNGIHKYKNINLTNEIQWHSQIQNNNSHYNYKIIHKYVQNQWTHSNACFKDVIKSFCIIL